MIVVVEPNDIQSTINLLNHLSKENDEYIYILNSIFTNDIQNLIFNITRFEKVKIIININNLKNFIYMKSQYPFNINDISENTQIICNGVVVGGYYLFKKNNSPKKIENSIIKAKVDKIKEKHTIDSVDYNNVKIHLENFDIDDLKLESNLKKINDFKEIFYLYNAFGKKIYDEKLISILGDREQYVCVVGNGPSAIKYEVGSIIDKFDKVVRFNSFQTDQYENCVGSKTDIWISRMSKRQPTRSELNIPTIIISYSSYISIESKVAEKVIDYDLNNYYCFNIETLKSLNVEYKTTMSLSTGLIGLLMLIKYYNNPLHIIGFDCFKDPGGIHYFKDSLNMTGHSIEQEYDILKQLIEKNKVKIIDDEFFCHKEDNFEDEKEEIT